MPVQNAVYSRLPPPPDGVHSVSHMWCGGSPSGPATSALNAIAAGVKVDTRGAQRRSVSTADAPSPGVVELKKRLRQREDDVMHAVSLGQVIVEDLRVAKREAEKYRSIVESPGVRCDLESIVRSHQECSRALLAVTEEALEDRVIAFSEAAARKYRAERSSGHRKAERERLQIEATENARVAAEHKVLKSELQSAKADSQKASAAAGRLREELSHEKQANAELKKRLDSSVLRAQNTDEMISRLKETLKKRDRELGTARRESDCVRRALSPVQRALRDAREDRDRLLVQSRGLQEQMVSVSGLKERESAMRRQIAAHTSAQRAAESRLTSAEDEVRALSLQRDELKQQTQRLRAHVQQLESARERPPETVYVHDEGDREELLAARERAEEAEVEAAELRREAARLRQQLAEAVDERTHGSSKLETARLARKARDEARRADEAEVAAADAQRAIVRARKDKVALAEQLSGVLTDNEALRAELSEVAPQRETERSQALAALQQLADDVAEIGLTASQTAGLSVASAGPLLPSPRRFTASDSLVGAVAYVSALVMPLRGLLQGVQTSGSYREVSEGREASVDTSAPEMDSGQGFWASLAPAPAAAPSTVPAERSSVRDVESVRLHVGGVVDTGSAVQGRAQVPKVSPVRRRGVDARSSALRELCEELSAAKDDLQILTAAAERRSAATPPRDRTRSRSRQSPDSSRKKLQKRRALRCPFAGCNFATRRSANLRVHTQSCKYAGSDSEDAAAREGVTREQSRDSGPDTPRFASTSEAE